MHFFELPAFLLWTRDSPNAVHCSKLVSNCDTIYNNDVFSFYLKIVRSKLYYHRHIWIRYNLRIDTTELLMYFSFSVPKIEKSTEKSNFLIFRENIFFPFQFFLLFDFVNQNIFMFEVVSIFFLHFSHIFYCWNIILVYIWNKLGLEFSSVFYLEGSDIQCSIFEDESLWFEVPNSKITNSRNWAYILTSDYLLYFSFFEGWCITYKLIHQATIDTFWYFGVFFLVVVILFSGSLGNVCYLFYTI